MVETVHIIMMVNIRQKVYKLSKLYILVLLVKFDQIMIISNKPQTSIMKIYINKKKSKIVT